MAVELYDDIEQSERVKRWIKEYSTAVIMGVVLAFGGIYGWRYWQSNQVANQQQAAQRYALFEDAFTQGDAEQAEALYLDLRANHARQTQTALAGLRVASEYIAQGRLDEASEIYTELLAQRRLRALHPVVRLRLARVHLDQGETDQAAQVIAGDAPAGFSAAWAELRGDIEHLRGNTEQARLAYQEALDTLRGDGTGTTQLLELKLNAATPAIAAAENGS